MPFVFEQKVGLIEITLRAYSQEANVRAKAKKSKDQQKRLENKRQTSKEIFAFVSAFVRCEWALIRKLVFLFGSACFGHRLKEACARD